MGRPALGQSGGTIALFKLDPDGATATRTIVKLGRSSVRRIEILAGLQQGDAVVLSDMSQWDGVERVRLR